MKSIVTAVFFFCLCLVVHSQTHLAKVNAHDPDLPEWAKLMYTEHPNYFEVVQSYQAYFANHEFEKTIHTQYFKRWVNAVQSQLASDGTLSPLNNAERAAEERRISQSQAAAERGSSIWQYAGPNVHYTDDGTLTPGFRHANVYCHDRSNSNPNLLYCGTESGGLYKSTDQGENWSHVSAEQIIGSVSAVKISSTDDNTVFMSAANDLWRSTDGGANWQVIGQPSFVSQDISAWEILFDPNDASIVFAACNRGLFRSTDGGNNWTEVLTNECMTVVFKPNDPSVVYAIQYAGTALNYSQFYKSTDGGLTFNLITNGWYAPAAADVGLIENQGGRLAVSEADPNRIYAVLVGYQQAGASITTNGWIGTWVSYDAGETWTFPHGLIGTPYTATHQNLMNFQAGDGDYTQIFYNTTIAVSQLDADKVLIGGLNLWRSDDACATYVGVGGYIGGIENFHVDQQEIRIYKTGTNSEEVWISNDGGISYSTDFMANHSNRNRGIRAVNLWGYDQGWNEDIMVGGRYHNGNMAYHEEYEPGEFLALGGGEAATGYVNYSDENKTFFSDIGGKILPDALSGLAQNISLNMSPNESYWNNSSSRILFDNEYFNIAWLGKDNKLYRSTDGGSTYSEFYAFGTNTADQVLWIEQSYADHNYMYAHHVVNNTSTIQRTTDHGLTWQQIPLPLTNRDMVFTLSGSNPDELWVAYYYSNNSNKVFHTTNAGASWINMSTSALNGTEPWAIAHQYGTDGGVYLAVKNGLVFYRNNTMNDWVSYSSGLPVSTEPLRIVPFYKGEKVRLACWNLGVWEAPFFEPSSLLVDFAAASGEFFCPGDSVHFVDHSVCSSNATYQWTFPGGTPATSTLKNPTVIYNETGTFSATLVVTDGSASDQITKTTYIESLSAATDYLQENFETGGFPTNWKYAHSTGGQGFWDVTNDASGYGVGTYAMKFDNWYYNAEGNRDEMWLGKLLSTTGPGPNGFDLAFDVAYSQYNTSWTDTLAVLISADCGVTWTEIYVKGGAELSTAPSNSTDPFVPLATQWRSEGVFVPYLGGTELIIAFQNRGHYGQWLYVDNINIVTHLSVSDASIKPSLQVYPNPASGSFVLSATQMNTGNCVMQIIDTQGALVRQEKLMLVAGKLEKRIDISAVAKGMYVVQLIDDRGVRSVKLEVN